MIEGLSEKTYKILICIILTAVVAVLSCLIWIYYSFWNLFLPYYIVILIQFLTLYVLILESIRFIVFPGHSKLWRRSVENSYQKVLAKKCKQKIHLLTQITELILNQNHKEQIDMSQISIYDIKKIHQFISETIIAFQGLVNFKIATKKQVSTLEKFKKLHKLMRLSSVYSLNQPETYISYWDWIHNYSYNYLNYINDNQENNIKFQSDQNGKQILSLCYEILLLTQDILKPLSWFQSINRWIFNDTFGTLNQVKFCNS